MAIDWTKVRGRFAWVACSRKAQVALGSIVAVLLTRGLPKLGFSDAEVARLINAVELIGSVWIGSIALEDAGKGNGTQPPSSTGGSQSSGH